MLRLKCRLVEEFSPDQTLPHVSLSALYFAVQESQEPERGNSLLLLSASCNILFVSKSVFKNGFLRVSLNTNLSKLIYKYVPYSPQKNTSCHNVKFIKLNIHLDVLLDINQMCGQIST